MEQHPTVIMQNPVGWWLSYKDEQWTGPFKTIELLKEAAKVIVPLRYKEYRVMQVMPWESLTIKNE